ncbi:MAG: DUF3488 and transglutaminase-like domain-containing protein [Planctomycetaceae bacterium]|jgi:hypothetical protein|nr:DUF3488 and transglutaminase-like domain-containing protein [Planctomycetaceae bacterium]
MSRYCFWNAVWAGVGENYFFGFIFYFILFYFMRSFFNLAIMLSVMPCLSTLMLGLGQDDIFLSVIMLVAACLSLYFTDYKRLIRLGDWTVNVLILAIVFFTIGDILRHWGEALAISIVRTLVFVEVVLLFREKDAKLCWQLLLISLLQVLVASAMQQSMIFGVLLVIYIFVGLCTLALLFLRNENLYYQRHSFSPSLSEFVREEIAARQDYGRLVRLALVTLLTGPIALAMSFSPRKTDGDNLIESELERQNRKQQNERWDILRAFFAVFAKESAKANNTNSNSVVVGNQLSDSSAVIERAWVQVPVRRNKRAKNRPQDKNNITQLNPQNIKSIDNNNRYPFFNERPAFSAGTMYSIGFAGGWCELFFRLFWSTFLVIFVAAILFFIIPRIGKIDFWQLNWTFGNSRWETAFIPRVGAIGFREEIRLGSLGSILPYHNEVMTVRFNKSTDGRIPETNANLSSYKELEGAPLYFRGIALTKYSNGIWKPQDEQSVMTQIMNAQNNNHTRQENVTENKTMNQWATIIETIRSSTQTYIDNIYGNVIDANNPDKAEKNYNEINATSNNINEEITNNTFNNEPPTQYRRRGMRGRYSRGGRPTLGEIESAPLGERDEMLARRLRMFFMHPLFGVRPGEVIEAGDSTELFFENGNDLVQLNMSIQPLDTSVFFAPWPFFMISDGIGRRGVLTYSHGSLHETRMHGSRQNRQIYTTGFKKGNQSQLIPCQEPIMVSDMLQVPDEGLSELILLAKEWDRESGIAQNNIIARAKYLESRFLESDKFHYKLGGITRDYDLDPLEDFITKNNYGHCEYFAGALVIMLRSVGIGARVIVGFKTEGVKLSANDVGCMVRQSDAHSWVEAFIPPEHLPAEFVSANKNLNNSNNRNYRMTNNDIIPTWWSRGGWLRLDPTPYSTDATLMTKFSFGLTDLINVVKDFWNYGVLNMNSERQTEWVYRPLLYSGQYLYERIFNIDFWQQTISAAINYYKSLLFSGSNATWQMRDRLLFGATIFLVVLFFVFIGVFILRVYRLFVWRRAGEKRSSATIDFYLRMEYLLTKYNRKRYPYETPLEYVRAISPFELTSFVLDAYYSVRYGGTKLTNDEQRNIKNTLDKLEKELEKRKQLSKQFDI